MIALIATVELGIRSQIQLATIIICLKYLPVSLLLKHLVM